MGRRVSLLRRRERGATAVEFAMVFPIFILCVLGLMEFGRAIWAQATLDHAVQSAARCAAVDTITCQTAAQAQQYAVAAAAGLSVVPANFTVAAQTCGMQVSASVPFAFVVPALFPYTLTLIARACFPT